MSVRYRGVTHKITYNPGPDGLQHFLETLQSIGIKVASASQVTFLCRSPDTGEEMALKGLEAFDAAAYCASITAAKRVLKEAKRQAPAPSTPDAGCSSGSDLGVRPEGPESPTAARSCERHVAHVHAEAFNHGEDWGHGQVHSRGSSFDASSSSGGSSSGGRGGQTDQDHHQAGVPHSSEQQQARRDAAAADQGSQLSRHQHGAHHQWWSRLLACVRQFDGAVPSGAR